ncbi:MAG: large subunit ribosomal protein L25 [Candidatus Paceibacteria bacterium]|jgi:large subunit ribosomal protein L25
MTITLPVTLRDGSKKVYSLRANGGVPAVVYGPKQEPLSISLEGKSFGKILKEAGESTFVELTGLEESIEVLIKKVEFNPVKQQVLHVDFYAVERGKEMTTTVALEFIGEAPVEKSGAGSVTKVLHEIEVTCMPRDLPSHIDVDISVLASVEDKIHIGDLKVPKGVTIEVDVEDSVAVVSAARTHDEPEDEKATEIDMDAIEVEQKGKDETEEGKTE